MNLRSSRRILQIALLVFLLGGCSQMPVSTDGSPYRGPVGGYDGPQLMVIQDFTLAVPASEIEALQQRHRETCIKLGCQITHLSINHPTQGAITASTQLHIAPKSYDEFAAALTQAPAKVTRHVQVAREPNAPAVDVEKRLAAKTRLRERLQSLLNDQNMKSAADLITIEKELSQVQGDIETLTSQLDQLHRQTDLIRVDISYVGTMTRFGLDTTPLYQATLAIGATLVLSVAALIYTLAAVAPWLPIIVVVWWFIRRRFRRRRMRQDQPAGDAA